MKLFTGWILSAGLVVMAAAANAQGFAPHETGRSPYTVVSDVEGPYAAMPAEIPQPRYGPLLQPSSDDYAVRFWRSFPAYDAPLPPPDAEVSVAADSINTAITIAMQTLDFKPEHYSARRSR